MRAIIQQGRGTNLILEILIPNPQTGIAEPLDTSSIDSMALTLDGYNITLSPVNYSISNNKINVSDTRFVSLPQGTFTLTGSIFVGVYTYNFTILNALTVTRSLSLSIPQSTFNLPAVTASVVIQRSVSGVVPDEDDLTVNQGDVMHFKPRTATQSSLGYKILRQAQSLASQLTSTNTIYEIRYSITSTDSITIPANSTLFFNGGSISAPLVFNNTTLSGSVNLKGSTLSGSLKNNDFPLSWICPCDGTSDDAAPIRQALKVANRILCEGKTYQLLSYEATTPIPSAPTIIINTRILINRSNQEIIGDNATFVVPFMENSVQNKALKLKTISIHSPRVISNQIKNIRISGIHFNIDNREAEYDSSTFQEWSHVINIAGINGLEIDHCSCTDFYGDFISLSHTSDSVATGERTRNINVNIHDNTIYGTSKNNRNGISIISGQHVVIHNNRFFKMTNPHMPGSIDIEPNRGTNLYVVEDITISNNYFYEARCAIHQYSPTTSTLSNVNIVGNRIMNSASGVYILSGTTTINGISIINNYIGDDVTRPLSVLAHPTDKNGIISDLVVHSNIIRKADYGTVESHISSELQTPYLSIANNVLH